MVSQLVTRVGNVTADPELRFTANGKAVCNFDLAYEPYDAETKQRGNTVFYRVTAWETLAQNICESITKGARVIVQGIPSTEDNSYTNKESGEKVESSRKVITVTAIGPDLRFAIAKVEKNARPVSNTNVTDPDGF